jgi:TonB-dependent starch-binding outer membrane protein SusC
MRYSSITTFKDSDMRLRSHLNAMVAIIAVAAMIGLAADAVEAQTTGTIRGQVIEGATQRPLAGVVITIAGTNHGALTNTNGAYLLTNIPVGSHRLVAQMIGYGLADATVTVRAGETAELNFQLSQTAIELDGLVVTGTPGVVQKRTLGNHVGGIDAANLAEVTPMTSVAQMLTARTPGLTVMAGSGQVGTAHNYKIRGAASLSAGNHPVFYVDGIRIRSGSQDGFGTSNNTTRETSYLDNINPDDIESIEVIKGPAAATLYGADAASGVIQIITKKGRVGQQAVQWSGRMEMGQTDWHLPMRQNYTLCTTTGELAHTSTSINRITSASWPGCDDMDPNAPWQDRLLVETPLANPGVLRTGDLMRYSLSARGGGDRYSFYISGEREEEEGVFWNNHLNRTSGRANFTVMPTDNLDVAFTFQYTTSDGMQPNNDNASNGWLRNSWRGRPGATAPWESGWLGLGPEQMKLYDNRIDNERFIFGSTLDYRPVDWFRNRLTMGFDAGDRINTLFFGIDRTGRAPHGALYANGYISHYQPTTRDYTVDYAGTIQTDLDRIGLENMTSSFSFGMQYLAQNFRQTQVVGEGLAADPLRLISSAAETRAFESRSEQRSLGFFLQEQIGWQNRLFVTVGLRMDDHSAFGANFSRIYYPKVSASYVISEEDFFSLPAVDNLRLRGSYGHAGNAPSPFQADRTYNATTVVLDDGTLAPALSPSAYGNPDLRAERGVEYELGFDASLFGDHVGLEFTYYNQRTEDALMTVPVAPSTGFTGSVLRNEGTISNSGIEVSIFGSPIRNPTLTWDSRLILATNKNEFVSFGDVDRDFIPRGYRSSQRFQPGYPMAGYWAEVPQRNADGSLILVNNRPVFGDEMEFVGPSMPTREAALTNTLTLFRDFQLYSHLDYKGGHYLFNMSEQTSVNDGNHKMANDPNMDVDTWMLWRWGGNRMFIERADFVKLREVSLRYNLRPEWASFFRTQSMSLTLAGRNLAVWHDYSGADPEVNIGGSDPFTRAESNSVPMLRQLVATVNFRF